jgi:hypothetical protein
MSRKSGRYVNAAEGGCLWTQSPSAGIEGISAYVTATPSPTERAQSLGVSRPRRARPKRISPPGTATLGLTRFLVGAGTLADRKMRQQIFMKRRMKMKYPTKTKHSLPDISGEDVYYLLRRSGASYVRRGRRVFYERTAWLPDPAYGGRGYCWRFGSSRVNPLDVKEVPEWSAFATDEDCIDYGLRDASAHRPDETDPDFGEVVQRAVRNGLSCLTDRECYALEMEAETRAIAAAKSRRNRYREELFSAAEILKLEKGDDRKN